MLIKSYCRLRISNGPSDIWELPGFGTGLVWPKLEAKVSECPLWFFDIWLSICSRTKYAIMENKLKGTRFFLGRFEILKKKSIT